MIVDFQSGINYHKASSLSTFSNDFNAGHAKFAIFHHVISYISMKCALTRIAVLPPKTIRQIPSEQMDAHGFNVPHLLKLSAITSESSQQSRSNAGTILARIRQENRASVELWSLFPRRIEVSRTRDYSMCSGHVCFVGRDSNPDTWVQRLSGLESRLTH